MSKEAEEEIQKLGDIAKPAEVDYKKTASNTLAIATKVESLDFKQRYDFMLALSIILNEWAELRVMHDDLAAPMESDE